MGIQGFSRRYCMSGEQVAFSEALTGCINKEIPTCLYAGNER